ncbi:MAG: hypothetical protein UGF89_03115 [Acutalibacteraceae bacterium]|nr:hypothetical protein [Acutalibacteraceae bacterium]
MNKKYGLIAIGIVIVFLVIALIVAGVTKDDNEKKDPAQVVSDEATLQAQEGNYKLKITKVLEVEPNPKEADAPEAKTVAIVVYEYTNDDIEHGLVIGSTHFKAYDGKGKELEQYPQKDLFEPSDVGASGTFTASVAFALNSEDDYLKIEYYKDISAKKPDVVFEQEW